jgi:hypothetical protein
MVGEAGFGGGGNDGWLPPPNPMILILRNSEALGKRIIVLIDDVFANIDKTDGRFRSRLP